MVTITACVIIPQCSVNLLLLSADMSRKYNRMRSVHGLVYRRDKWQCMMPECLCPDRRDIDRNLRGTDDPWAPSIDHVIELSRGGADYPGNMRAAHKLCNDREAFFQRHTEYGDREPLVTNLGDFFRELGLTPPG